MLLMGAFKGPRWLLRLSQTEEQKKVHSTDLGIEEALVFILSWSFPPGVFFFLYSQQAVLHSHPISNPYFVIYFFLCL